MAEPPEPARDPLFDDVDEWRDELDERFVDQLFVVVTAAFAAAFLVMVALMLFNGCTDAVERPPPTLPPVPPATLPLVGNHITVATTTTVTGVTTTTLFPP